MPYRFYITSMLGNRSHPFEIECNSDFAAMVKARGLLVAGSSIEIWRGDRLVGEVGIYFSRWSGQPVSKAYSRLDQAAQRVVVPIQAGGPAAL